MRISHHVLALLAVCCIGGLALAAGLHRIHGTLAEETRRAGVFALDEVGVERLEDALGHWLIGCDLIFGSGNTYLVPVAKQQGAQLLSLVDDLDHSFVSECGENCPLFEASDATLAAGPVAEARQVPLRASLAELRGFVQGNLARIASVLEADGPDRGGFLFGLLDELDVDSPAAIAAVSKLKIAAAHHQVEHDRSLLDLKAQTLRATLGLSAIYVACVLIAWNVTTRRLIWPLAKLTRAATADDRTVEAFEAARSGPQEIRQLADTLADSAKEIKTRLAELRANEDRFRSLFTCSNDAILVLDGERDEFVTVNPRALEMLEHTEASFKEIRPSDLHPHELEELAEFRGLVMAHRSGFTDQLSCRARSGRFIPVEVSASAFTTGEGRECMMVHVRDIQKRLEAETEREQMHERLRIHTTELETQRQRLAREMHERQRAQARLEYEATHDPLTGLPNRRWFKERMDQCVRSQQANPEASFCVIFIDLDDFKIVNDSLGHDAGDELLIATAEHLTVGLDELGPQGARERSAARLGGDEFVVLLEGLGPALNLPEFATRLQGRLRQPLLVGDPEVGQQEVAVGASLGIATSDPEHRDGDLLREADTAMYSAKLAGKSQYAIFDSSMHDEAQARLLMENDLRRAIEADELEVYLQPVVDLQTSEICSFEALVRWRGQDGRPVSPGEFIPLAEEVGLILPLGRQVLDKACDHLRRIDREANGSHFAIAVNASRRQLLEPGYVEDVLETLARHEVAPERLTLEVTETMVMSGLESMRRVLERLQSAGIRIAMDDFGTGHSSLSCLHDIPLDILKIDQSFICSLGLELHHTAIVASIITLAGHLGLRVVAEGVETAEQMAQMLALDCDCGQGYLFSRPLPIDDLLALLNAGSAMRLSA